MRSDRADLEDDWDLMNRAADDRKALESLFRRHRDYVYRVIWSLLRCRATAEDLTQDVFYRIAGMRRRFFRRAAYRSWLYRVAANVARDHLRKSRRTVALNDYERADTSADPGHGRELEEVLRALDRLPPRQRQVVTLRMFEGFSTAETAAALKISAGSVKTHLHRGMNELKSVFTEPGDLP